MSPKTRSAVRFILAAALFFTAASLQAADSKAYVSICCDAPSTASVFTAWTLAPARTITTGSGGDGIALSPDGKKMFVSSDIKQELEVFSTATGALLARVPVPISISGTPPLELAINPDGAHVYVFAPQDVPNSLLMAVDTTTYQVTGSLNLPFNESLGPLLVSADGTQIYFEVGLVNQYIQVIDAATLKPVTQVVVGESPNGLCVTSKGMILMTDTLNELLVIDAKKATIVNRFSLSSSPQILAGAVISSPDGQTAYISFGQSAILAVDITTGATVFNAPINYKPSQLAIGPEGSVLYSIDYVSRGAPSISAFQIPSQTVLATVRQLGPLSSMALSHDGGALYVLNASTSAIVPVDVSTHTPGRATLGGVGINSLAIPPDGKAVWASTYGFIASGDILILNHATGRLNFIAGPTGGLAFSPSGSMLYVANPPVLSAIDTQSGQTVAQFHAANLENIGQAIPSPDGKLLYVSITFVSGSRPSVTVLPQGEIVVLDASALTRVKTINTPGGLGVFALSADGSTLVCTSNRGHLNVISTATGKVTETITLQPANGVLQGLALSSDGSTAYVSDAQNSLLFVAELATQTQQAAIAVGTQPLNVAISPNGSEAWVATAVGLDVVNLGSGTVSGPVRLSGTPSAIVFAP